jgi:hypothetical protein
MLKIPTSAATGWGWLDRKVKNNDNNREVRNPN